MSELTDALDQIIDYWNRVHPGKVEQVLQPGADAREIREIEEQFGVTFPPELTEFYHWSRGAKTGFGLNVVAGGSPFKWPDLGLAAQITGQFNDFGWWQSPDRFVWPFFDADGRCVSVQITPDDDAGSVWYNDVPGEFSRICDSMADYFQTVLDDYPPEDEFPVWEELEEVGFSFESRGKYNYSDAEWLSQIGYGPNH